MSFDCSLASLRRERHAAWQRTQPAAGNGGNESRQPVARPVTFEDNNVSGHEEELLDLRRQQRARWEQSVPIVAAPAVPTGTFANPPPPVANNRYWDDRLDDSMYEKPWFEMKDDGEWYCNLCSKVATAGHIASSNHVKRASQPEWYGYGAQSVPRAATSPPNLSSSSSSSQHATSAQVAQVAEIAAASALRAANAEQELMRAQEQLALQRRQLADLTMPTYWSLADEPSGQRVVCVQDQMTQEALRCALAVERTDWLGDGRDYACPHDRPYSSLQFVQAWRVENHPLWTRYRAAMQHMRAELESCALPLPGFGMLTGIEAATGLLPADMDTSVNETYLLHGTRPENILQIAHEGLNERFTGRAYFGYGSYLAEDAGKADQYVMPVTQARMPYDLWNELYGVPNPTRIDGNIYFAFLCRAALGFPAITKNGERTIDGSAVWALSHRRAERRELAEVPGARNMRFHSEVVECTPDEEWANVPRQEHRVYRFREFVMTHSDRVYPEYLIAYRRSR